jgi:hypothetical protein
MNMDKIWDALINKAHVAIVVVCQASIFVAHWKFKLDLSESVKSTVSMFYLFMAGHFGASQAWPDKPGDPPPASGTDGSKG